MRVLFKFFILHPLSGPLGIIAFFRFFRWQIKSRLVRRVFVHGWIGESKFYVTRGETGLTGNIYVGLHDFTDMSFLIHFLRPTDCFIDVGSNSGSYTILASAAVGAKSVSIEPALSTFSRLLANIELNGIGDRVRAVNVGLSSESGVLRITTGNDTTNHLVSENLNINTEIVKVTTLDELTFGCTPILIKIDVEGWEYKVLEGAFKTLKDEKLKAIIIEINGNAEKLGYSDTLLIEKLSTFGFTSYSYNPFKRSLMRTGGKNMSGGNTIFIRDIKFVEERIISAEKLKIFGMKI